MNKKNNLGLDICFMNEDDPFVVFKEWMSEAEKNEINDPKKMYEEAGLDSQAIENKIHEIIDSKILAQKQN